MKTTSFPVPRHQRRRIAGLGLFDVMVASFVLSIILAGIFNVTRAVARIHTRTQTESTLADQARLTTDEVLMQLRGASQIVAVQNYGYSGISYNTNSSNIVVQAQGYDPSTDSVALSGVTDYIAFVYNSQTKILSETVYPGTGSVRPSRNAMAIAKNVSAVSYTYRSCDNFTAIASSNVALSSVVSGSSSNYGTATLTLNATPTTTPTVWVDGVKVTVTSLSSSGAAQTYSSPTAWYNSSQPKQVIVTHATLGSNIQVSYPVSATANSGTDLSNVNEVQIDLTFSDTDGTAQTRTITLGGTVRLRNNRN